jgi:predicted PurR-regulated permease PerM
LGGIDADWASFSEAIERLMTFVRNKDGIESVIKNLDGKLSEAIMHAMTNGPDLQKKVSNTSHFAVVIFLSLFLTIFYYGDFRDFIDSRFKM